MKKNNDMEKNNDYVTKTDLDNLEAKLSNKIEGNNITQIKWTIGILIAFAILFFSVQGYMIDDIKEDIAVQNARIESIETRIGSMENRIGSIENRIENIDNKIDSLRNLFIIVLTKNGKINPELLKDQLKTPTDAKKQAPQDVDQVEGDSGANGLVVPPDGGSESLKPVRVGQGTQNP